EEERFRHTLKTGLGILDGELNDGGTLSGPTAFLLHDTYGFPLELTEEIAGERSVSVDLEGFTAEMEAQRERAKAARRDGSAGESMIEAYRDVLERFGTTEFTGYVEDVSEARVLELLEVDGPDGEALVEVFLDRTPFYAEAGGQIGDTGTITTQSGTLEVLDTTYALPNLRRHLARQTAGSVAAGETATAAIDVSRRSAIRRNHTGTHVLHWALRSVLGEHVKQAGSHVGPDRLRFDFSHYAAVTAEEIAEIERLANSQTLSNSSVRAFETTKDEAESLGAIAFFGDKYGDVVRVLEAGSSVELCGGTHVRATGDIGTIKIVAESSIGSNLRRIEAVTGEASVALLQRDEALLAEVGVMVGATGGDVIEGVRRKLDEVKALNDELKALRSRLAAGRAAEIAAAAVDGVVVDRVDVETPGDLRELALAVRQQGSLRRVVLVGATASGGVALVSAVGPDAGVEAAALIRDAAKAVGGGGGGKGDVATAGGKDPSGIDEALKLAREAATA
ncbi:MAG: alanine--tRNA ligase-related protein, partial [Ilumatobacteraceae bacterium]